MLEIVVSILYFINKVLLLFNQKSGWIIGAIASGLAIFYFFSIQLYIFFALEIACFFIMIYGVMGRQDSKRIAVSIYGLCAVVTLYLVFSIPETGILEFFTSLSFMIAFVLLADQKGRPGWILLGISLAIMSYITFMRAQYFFAALQLASVIVCIVGSINPALKFPNESEKIAA